MKPILIPAVVLLLAACASSGLSAGRQAQLAEAAKTAYPTADRRVPSPGHTTYFVDPAKGDDANAGTVQNKAWRSLAKVNALKLAPGDKVVIAPGLHTETLMPLAEGSAAEPVVIQFLPGTHEFAVETAHRRPLFVSNSCDAPTEPKPIGILVENSSHLRFEGAGVEGDKKTLILLGGRMVEVFNNHAQDIAYANLAFDLKRPTVSEYRVLETGKDSAIIQVAEGSDYAVENGKFTWKGDLGPGGEQDQDSIPAEGRAWRIWGQHPLAQSKAEDLGGRKVRLTFPSGTGGLIKGHQIQSRHGVRDSVGVHNARSKDIRFTDCDFYALTNMGLVSQFTENIAYIHVRVAPPAGTIRTCPAWADIFQFSNCKGEVVVEDCVGSGMQDDFVNCHGTHLRITGKPAENQLKLRYMHPQTYGFQPYIAGDEIAVIGHDKLRELPGNPRRKVTDCHQASKDGKEWVVTLDGPAPAFGQDDAVDNLTWHPNLTLRNNKVDMDPVRGFLITTRGKVLVEGNTIQSHMAGILIEDDARGWYESTCIRDLLIRNNTFKGCGIEINPQTVSNDPKEPVHENIRIVDNVFDGGGISAKNTRNLVITGNRTPAGGKVPIHIAPSCSEVKTD